MREAREKLVEWRPYLTVLVPVVLVVLALIVFAYIGMTRLQP